MCSLGVEIRSSRDRRTQASLADQPRCGALRDLRPPNVFSFSCGRPRAPAGRAARRLVNGAPPCALGEKRGFSPERGKWPATSCDEELVSGDVARRVDSPGWVIYAVP